jgi:hypothetical protein
MLYNSRVSSLHQCFLHIRFLLPLGFVATRSKRAFANSIPATKQEKAPGSDQVPFFRFAAMAIHTGGSSSGERPIGRLRTALATVSALTNFSASI